MANEGLTQILARYVAETPTAQIAPEAMVTAKRSLLDGVGVMLAASGLEPACAAFADQARDGGAGKARVLGFGFQASALAAAFANGALAHALDYEDAYDGAPIHPNAATIPAALAVAEARGSVSGADLLAAIALGCDLVCRLGLALTKNPDEFGFYPPPILGAFGACAGAGRVMGLNAAQMVDAFALTLSSSIASAQFKSNPESQIRAVRDAFSAQAGVQAAQLAARGVKGFDGVFEGKAGLYALYARGAYDPATVLKDLGGRFEGAFISFKPWPACRGTHAFIEAALKLQAAHGFKAEDVAHFHALGAPVMTMLAEPLAQKMAPQTAIDAKFSVFFTVAAALAHGDVKLAHFAPEALRDARVLALAKRGTFEIDTTAGPGMDAATQGTLTLTLKDGRTLQQRIETPRGHPANPLSDAELDAKFLDCASYAKRPAAAETLDRFVARVRALEQSADVSHLCEGL